jgi:hypothetical protein
MNYANLAVGWVPIRRDALGSCWNSAVIALVVAHSASVSAGVYWNNPSDTFFGPSANGFPGSERGRVC